ncbi:ParB/RepB/Spo0J family partition protein [Sulfitobacter sp. M13]
MTNPKSKSRAAGATSLPELEPQMIPLNKLVISPKNVRKTPATEDQDAELYASIKETGLKQNLLVHKVGTKFHVHAGGRRLAALNKLAEDKIIKPSHPIACSVEDPDQAEDTSAAENMIRAAMHAADQFEAFAALRKKGRTEDEIAKRFGITNDLVRRRLKLASVSPDLMRIFREGEMSLDCVMAFTLTDDHARQVETWEVVKQHYNPSPPFDPEPANPEILFRLLQTGSVRRYRRIQASGRFRHRGPLLRARRDASGGSRLAGEIGDG